MLYDQDSCGVPAATKGVPVPAPLDIVFFCCMNWPFRHRIFDFKSDFMGIQVYKLSKVQYFLP
jgi:hypothetical protein